MPLILIGGGSRSGKSRFAASLARKRGSRLGFIATAQAHDDEMQARISTHRLDRGDEFVTIEEPYDLPGAILSQGAQFDAVVVDCLTLWLSNLMLAEGYDVEAESARMLEAASKSPAALLLVTNEVGCGIVPENALARRFRDAAGLLNQQTAQAADEVYWMAFGCPLRLK
ncbi:MAG: bifunctional adenosylcobinamide kinase/adenosylcobinamide-phosphate guanylyltransferase [Bryobacteraceae bacterium]